VNEQLETSTATIKLQKACSPSPPKSAPTVLVKVEEQQTEEGVVKNLKKEFEAKSVRVRTEPIIAPTAKSEPSTPEAVEDLSVKLLVDRFEVNNPAVLCRSISHSPPGRQRLITDTACPKRRSSPASLCNNQQPPVPARKSSSFEATAGANNNVIVRNLIMQSRQLPQQPTQPLSIAKSKKQQGKTHPLARLAPFAKGRHTNPVFNTM
jgi:hypothetical protein